MIETAVRPKQNLKKSYIAKLNSSVTHCSVCKIEISSKPIEKEVRTEDQIERARRRRFFFDASPASVGRNQRESESKGQWVKNETLEREREGRS